MPNGRSGGFIIEKADLLRLIATVANDELVGSLLTFPRPREIRVGETVRAVEECPHNRIVVEEQDHSSYIIHVRNEPDALWIMIASSSPLFAELRRQHARWTSERPDWKGWIGF